MRLCGRLNRLLIRISTHINSRTGIPPSICLVAGSGICEGERFEMKTKELVNVEKKAQLDDP
jgi:hypothetical protein